MVGRLALALKIGREPNASTLRFGSLHECSDHGQDVSNITTDAIAVTPNARHDSLDRSSYVILIDQRFV